jgi:hypothetical protein
VRRFGTERVYLETRFPKWYKNSTMPRTPRKHITKPNRTKKATAPNAKRSLRAVKSLTEPQEFPISHSMLRAMYDAMVESRLWAQSRNLVPVISEATAVATAAVLHRTDTLAAPADGRTLYPVADHRTRIISLDLAKLATACEEARRKRRGAVIAICPQDIFETSSFQDFLRQAVEGSWPLICVELSNRFFNPRARIPEIDVDGHDAVAMFRVVSESVRRARNHRGPAVIHAHGATETQIPDPLGDPLIRFERYLSAKGLTTQRIHVVHEQ